MKEKIISISFISIILLFFIFNILTKDKEVSKAERRKLTTIDNLTKTNILNWSKEFEKYCLDQCAYRDEFRSIKANVELNLFKKLDNNGIFIVKDKIYKMDEPLNEKSVNDFVKKINKIYLNNCRDMKAYLAIIPDKNYYNGDNHHLKMDYLKLYDIVSKGIKGIKYIEISSCLNIDDYYNTDTHWKQENLSLVVKKLSENMNFNVLNNSKLKNEFKPFYGVYHLQSALNVKPDTLIYLTDEIINNAQVYNLQKDKYTKVYDNNNLLNIDPYDIFLDGAAPFLVIENNKSKIKRELVIFRDSFASSITPLLISSYSKITLIDLRYMNQNILDNYIKFTNQDILFLFSTLVINNSSIIRD